MSETRTSEHFHGQDEYHRSYFHDIDAPAPLKDDRVDPNLPDLESEKVVDPEEPSAPTKSGREEDSKDEADQAKTEEPKTKTASSKSRPAAGTASTGDK